MTPQDHKNLIEAFNRSDAPPETKALATALLPAYLEWFGTQTNLQAGTDALAKVVGFMLGIHTAFVAKHSDAHRANVRSSLLRAVATCSQLAMSLASQQVDAAEEPTDG
jgi:hypothetical protein